MQGTRYVPQAVFASNRCTAACPPPVGSRTVACVPFLVRVLHNSMYNGMYIIQLRRQAQLLHVLYGRWSIDPIEINT